MKGYITREQLSDSLKQDIESIGDKENLQTENKDSLVDAINEVFQSVSNGKQLIASAITDKGIPTSNNDTFQIMADNIRDISSAPMIEPKWTININTVTAICYTLDGIFKEFRVNNGEWQSSNVFNGLIGNTQYTFDGKLSTGESSSITVISPKANQSKPNIPVASVITTNSITITVDSGCKIKYNNNLYTSPYTFTGLADDTEYIFYAVKEATNNLNESVSDVLNVSTKPIIKIYGIDIDETNSNPSNCVTYTDDAVGFAPLFCGDGTLDYGSWEDTFVIQGNKPCLLKNGVRQYYLNPNDYTKKENGEASDITSGNDGDVMAEFKKCYYKLWKEGNIVKFRVADGKVDDTWCCNAFLSEDGNGIEKDYMYISTYESYSSSSKMRSLSGKAPWVSYKISSSRTRATANGNGYQQLTLSKYTFITMLTTLVTKSLDHQTKIGQGRSKSSNTSKINTGTMNTKGQFWGDQTATNGMKVFHIENFYGNIFTFMDGLIVSSRVTKYKVNGPYNDSGSDYTIGYSIPSTSGYISKINCDNNNGIIPSTSGGSATTYYTDYIWQNSGNYISMIGGAWYNGSYVGSLYLSWTSASTDDYTDLGSRLTFS